MNQGYSRRDFIRAGAALLLLPAIPAAGKIPTVRGAIAVSSMGTTLVHEHFLVDFIGADKTSAERWNRDAVVKKVLPFLLEARKAGIRTMLDCTPAFLGRDVHLLKKLSEESGLHIITNTGLYGAVKNKYLPGYAFSETEQQLALRWIKEFEDGIEDSGIKPGFIKISVDAAPLSSLHEKLVKAACLAHLKTGLTICSHTGLAPAAFEELELVKKMGVHPSAFVWTHAQAEKDLSLHVKAAREGAWISLDGIAWGEFDQYAQTIIHLDKERLLGRVLISHDAGWYKPEEKDGGSFTGYTNIHNRLLPLLKNNGFTQKKIRQLLEKNPAEAFAIRVRKY